MPADLGVVVKCCRVSSAPCLLSTCTLRAGFSPAGRSLGQGRLPWVLTDAEAKRHGFWALSWPLTALLLPLRFCEGEGGGVFFLTPESGRVSALAVSAVLAKCDLSSGPFPLRLEGNKLEQKVLIFG